MTDTPPDLPARLSSTPAAQAPTPLSFGPFPSQIATGIAVQASLHVGPLPPAREFADYEAAYPGAAAWILSEAAKASEHGRAVELTAAKIQARDALLHRALPFALVAILIGASAVMAIYASKVLGGLAFFGTLAGVVTVYLRGNPPPR